MEKRVRTRFAPSPTGYMHIGNLRTALFAYLIAKKQDGDFILRIEDTDQERYVEGAVDVIYDTLRVAGLNWDEGPDIGGPVGPYVQSERMGMFKSYAEELVKTGHAYYCFCGKERLEEVRKIQEASHIAPCMTATAGTCRRRRFRRSWMPVCPMSSVRKCRWRERPHSTTTFTAMLP